MDSQKHPRLFWRSALLVFAWAPFINAAWADPCRSVDERTGTEVLERLDGDLQKILIADGGKDVGNGGDWLLAEIYKAGDALIKRLAISNPDSIPLPKLRELINTMEIEISEDPLFLNGKPKDAINYFPERKLIRFYRKRWEEHFTLKRDTLTLLYHELDPYFKGNEPNYIRSRSALYQNPLPPNLSTIRAGVFTPEFQKAPSCGVQIESNPDDLTIKVTWKTMPDAPTECSAHGVTVYQCQTAQPLGCVSARNGEAENQISVLSDGDIKIGWVYPDAEQSIYLRKSAVASSAPEPKIFSEMAWSKSGTDGYAASCAKAREKALSAAMKRCEANLDRPDRRCKAEKAAPLAAGSSIGENGCAILATVKEM
ncbi:MAG: hypothetical protein NDJ89_00770 [Oligoflexia bacterium]|nr:hypothetical protein [Oligoflexia bacterium]